MLTLSLAAHDLGCVKRSSAEFNMCLRALTHINVAPDNFENRFYTTKTLNRHRREDFAALHSALIAQ